MVLETIFSTVLNMSLTASLVILIVCVARLAMKKAPKIYSYLLWALVLFRLLCPVSLLTSFSVIPERISSGQVVSDWEADYIEEVQVHYNNDITYDAAVSAGRAPVSNEEGRTYVVTGNDGISEPKTVKNTIMPLLAITWLVGIGAVLLPGVISFIRIKGKTKVVIPLGKNIYIGDDVESPFVMGIFRPTVYLPGTLDPSEREYIIAHERHHISRGDHIFKALGFLALAVHWFNPLAWLAFALAVRDMEMSCDEAVIRKLGENVRAEYSASLLKLATGHRLFAGGPLAFGENDPKGRVRNLSKWKKPAIWVMILCVAACAVLAVVLLTDLKTDPAADREDEIQETTENTAGVSSEEFFTMEDFSSLVIQQSTYADVCKLVPKAQQYELTKLDLLSYCDYPTQSSGFIRIFYVGENLQISSIKYYPVSGAFYKKKQKEQVIVADDGTEYVFLAPETKLSYIGELEYAGGIHGEEETGFPMGLPEVIGMYKIKNSKSDNLLIRYYSDSEWYSIYRKASLPEVDISLENCTRLEYFPNGTQEIPREHATCGEGIVDLEEIAKFLTEIRAQKDPETAGLYELVMKPNGMFENCYQCGVVLACFAEEPNVAVRLRVMSYNDLAYSISIEDKEYVLPATWLQKLQIENQGLHEKTVYAMEDFSSLVKNESTYEDLCDLMPESHQPEMLPYLGAGIGYCDYSAKGGFIRIFFDEDLIMRDIRFYVREGSELYPIKDTSVFSFIVPGETTIMEVMETVPHPTYSFPATSSMLSWLDYAVVDGSEVRIFFDTTTERRGIVHSVEVIKNNNAQTVKGYPLVFADIGEERTNYFVLGFVSDGKLITTDQFLYSGKKLDYYLENPSEVTSDILPVGTRLAFVNEKWESFRANTTGLYCEGEMMYGDIWVYGKVDVIHYGKGYYLGAPSGVKLYPNSVACRDDGFTMDLNADDWIDQVAWTFTESEEGDDLFDYEIKVKVGDREQVIVNEEGFACGKEDLSVWPIDLEQDGTYELVIYEKSYFRFGYLRIYRLNGTTYEEQFSYICENMP